MDTDEKKIFRIVANKQIIHTEDIIKLAGVTSSEEPDLVDILKDPEEVDLLNIKVRAERVLVILSDFEKRGILESQSDPRKSGRSGYPSKNWRVASTF